MDVSYSPSVNFFKAYESKMKKKILNRKNIDRLQKVITYILPYHPLGGVSRQKGVAIMMVISALLFIVLLVQETVFETQVEHRSANAELNTLKAYYAAKAGLEISLLRIKTYNKLSNYLNQSHKNHISSFRTYLDMIWKIPFQWPPVMDEDSSKESTSKDKTSLVKSSFMKARYQTTLISTGGLIDINDLASPVRSIRQWTYEMLYWLILNLQKEKKDLKELNKTKISEILNNIKDWIDSDSNISNGPFENSSLPESSVYQEGFSLKPFNRSLISKQELRMIAGMTDALYRAIEPFITIIGEKGLNINTAPYPVIQALSDQFPEEVAQEIAENTTPFVNSVVFTKNTFAEFLEKKNLYLLKDELLDSQLNSENKKKPSDNLNKQSSSLSNFQKISHLIFDAPHNFKIISRGFAGRSQRTITVIYVDMPALSHHFNNFSTKDLGLQKIKKGVKKPHKQPNLSDSNDESDMVRNKVTSPLKPMIIYWKESY